MYLAVPDAISAYQPDCRSAASRHFKSSGVWDMLPRLSAGGLRQRAMRRAGTPVSARVEVCACGGGAEVPLGSHFALSAHVACGPGWGP